MRTLRAFLRLHSRLALGLVVLALLIKALIPAGYMLGGELGGGDHVLTVTICTDASGGTMTQQIAVPTEGKGGHAKAEGACAWGLLGHAALAGADAVLLAAALAFILALGFAAIRAVPLARSRHLRPPLRGPPAFA